jgi:hypothetical protein
MRTNEDKLNNHTDGSSHSIFTGGGANIEKDINIKEGDFVGRDHVRGETVYRIEAHEVINHWC